MNKSYKEIKMMYDNATDDEERGDTLCLLTENYLFGDIERREIEDYLAEQCPEIIIEDYLDEECVWEMLGLSEEEYLQSLDEQTNHNVSVKVGDIVIFDLNAHYENKDMRYLVRTNHRFLIMDVSDKDVLVYAMTTKVDRKNRFPNEYTEVQSGDRLALVQLNAFGRPNKKKIYRVVDTLSEEDLQKVKSDLSRRHIRTTKCECLHNARMDEKFRFEDWDDYDKE